MAREQWWIDKLEAADREYGYNISPTAGSRLGIKEGDELRPKKVKAGRARAGWIPSEETRRLWSAQRQGVSPGLTHQKPPELLQAA